MSEQNSAQIVAEDIKRYVDESDGDEIAARVITRLITDAIGSGWQPCSVSPSHDGVESALFMMSHRDRYPLRVYFKNGWRDAHGKVINDLSVCYWTELPPLPERRFESPDDMRSAFIVERLPDTQENGSDKPK